MRPAQWFRLIACERGGRDKTVATRFSPVYQEGDSGRDRSCRFPVPRR
jgi:hypothetical protein